MKLVTGLANLILCAAETDTQLFPCGSVIKETAATIYSKNFNFGRGAYPPNQNCNWTIEAPLDSEHLVIMFQDYFGLEGGEQCRNDYVAIYDGRDKNSQLLGKYCGILRPPPIISSRKSLFVEFYSDSSIQTTGFIANTATFSLGPASMSSGDVCGGYITEEESYIESPNYPARYGNNKLCIWRITVNPRKTLVFTLEHVDLEDSTNCNRDGLALTSLSPHNKLIGKYCGQEGSIHKKIKSDSNDVIIVFNSDLAGSFSGFRLSYTTEQLDSICKRVTQLSGRRGQTKSVKIPEDYKSMLTCSWKLDTAKSKVIEVHVTHLNTSENCLQDYVAIHDGEAQIDREIARVCGTQHVNKSFRSTGSSLYIIFHIDVPDPTKFIAFKWREFKAVVKPALVQLGNTTSQSEILYHRENLDPTVTPNLLLVNSKCPVSCPLNEKLDDRLCRCEYVLRVKLRIKKMIKSRQPGNIYYWIVDILQDFKLGRLAFKKSANSMITKLFIECKNCPSLKKNGIYVVAGNELRFTKIVGNDPYYNAVLNANDVAIRLFRSNHKKINNITQNILYSCTDNEE